MNHGNKKKMEMGGSFDDMLRAYELSLLDKTRVPDEEDIPSLSERTSDAFELGEIVWDTEMGKYDVVVGIFKGKTNTGDEYIVKTTFGGIRPVEILRKRGELGDSGNAMDMLSAITNYGYMKGKFPEDYPPILNMPKMAKGGTLELDPKQAKKAFHLPIEMAIYVPSTSDVDKVISDSEMKKRVAEVSTYLSNIFGGYTSQETIGGYVDSKGNLVNEDVVRVVSFGATDKFEKNKAKILKKIAEWCSKWSQEAIGFEVEGDLYYIPENFAKGGNIRKYANGGSVFYIPYTTEISFKHKDDMDGVRRTSTFTKQIDSSIAFEEARTIAEEAIDERLGFEGYDKDDISEIEIDDFYLGMPEEEDEKKFRGEVGIEENDEMLPEIERSGRWGDEYALLCDELANYKMGGRIKNALKKRFGKSKRGDVEIMEVEEIQESNNPKDMMKTLNYDPQMILSALKEAKDLAPETARSLDLYMASQIRNKQKFSDFLNATPNELLGRRFAVGGEVKFVDLSDYQSPRTIWESRKSKNTNQNSFGSFAHRINKKYIGDYYLYRLSDFDEDYYSHIPLKKGEILARIETDNMVGGEMPLVKINIDKGRVYFMSDDNDRFSDEDEKNPKFDRASADVIYLSLDKAILRYVDFKHKFAKGGRINDFEKILLDRDFKKYSGKYNQDVYSNDGYLKNFDVKITDNGDIAQLYSPNEYNWQTFISFLEPQKLANFLDSQDYETKEIQDFTLYAKGGDVKEDVLEVSNQLANASKMHKQQSQELKRLSKKMAKGGGVSKMSYDEFIETLRPYQIEGGFGSTLKKGMKMYYLKSTHPLFNKNFDHQNKRKAYKEYVDFISQDGNERFREPKGYAKGGEVG